MGKTYIYTLSCPVSNRIRYVGKTIRPQKRKYEHNSLYINSRRRNHKNCWCLSLLKSGLKPIFNIIDETDGDWEYLEQKWIEHYRNSGCDLVNESIGGGSSCGRKLSDTHKELLSKNSSNKTLSDEQVLFLCQLINIGKSFKSIKKLIPNLSYQTLVRVRLGTNYTRITNGLIEYKKGIYYTKKINTLEP